MLVDVGVQAIFGGAFVVLPEVGLPEADPVQGPFRLAREAIGELFRVGELADQRLDPSCLTFEVSRGTYVARLL
jgi:hypothetical protein